jgi:predicted O-linked N-acetylglucosamine transferase (SPINDLY family)
LNCTARLPQAIFDEHRAWAKRHAQGLYAHAMAHANIPGKDRRLRVGYVSPDFCDHPVGRFVETLLVHRDPARFETWCYYAHEVRDPVNARLRTLADHFVDCARHSDEDLVTQIRADAIDILVDLAGHTRHNRLLVFARKPAPVQATYLGYPTTTGIAAIDYRVTDVHVDPEGGEALNAERAVRLGGSRRAISASARRTRRLKSRRHPCSRRSASRSAHSTAPRS